MAEQDAPPVPLEVELSTITLDVKTITLGEMEEAEHQSGRDFQELLRQGSATRRLLGLFLHEWRSSGQPPSWRTLSDRRPLGKPSSSSPSPSAGPPNQPPG